jgi:hypothetical protein
MGSESLKSNDCLSQNLSHRKHSIGMCTAYTCDVRMGVFMVDDVFDFVYNK